VSAKPSPKVVKADLGPALPTDPAARLRSLRTLQALREGRISVPLRCGHCGATSLQIALEGRRTPQSAILDLPAPKQTEYECLACGRRTPIDGAHRARQVEMRRLIAEGADV
jgi:hypothetical protein